MAKMFFTFLKRYFYLIGLINFVLLFVLAQSHQADGPNQLSNEEQALISAAEQWQQNALDLRQYIQGAGFESESKPDRFKNYNEFSNKNNNLMFQTLESPASKKNINLHNTLAKISIMYADYFESTKALITSSQPMTASEKQTYFKSFEDKLKIDSKILFKKDPADFNLNTHSLFLLISFSSLALAFLHLMVLNNHTRKENSYLNSQVDTFKKVISNMTEGVIVTDKYGFFTFCNESAKNIIGPAVNDIYYPSSIDLLGFHNMQGRKLTKEELPMYTALKKGLVNDQEMFVKNPVHSEGIFVSCSNGYFVDNRGITMGSVVVLKNITAKKQIEQFWQSEKERALEASKMKSDFLASMSHEIRTPMNGIMGLTTLLKETTLGDEQKDYVATIQRSAKSLLTLINDILDHSKIEAGKLDIINSPFNLKTLALDIADNFKPLILEKNIELKLNLDNLEHHHFNSDSNRIRQILINLMGNAIKFTKKGFVEIKIESVAKNSKLNTENIKITVLDTGPGMTQVEVSHLFQKYFQTQNGQTVGGTGLGLSICKQLVDLLGGEIGVTSEQHKGSQFWFQLPLQISESLDQDAITTASESQLFKNQFEGLILIAEDNVINQKVITNYLTKMGFKTMIAQNGQEAIELYQTHSPNLILMDSNMPIMNGLEATKKIKELQSKSNHHCPIVGLSADVRQNNLDESLKAGMTAFLTKPIELNKLVGLLQTHFSSYETTPSQLEKIKDLFIGDQLLIEVLLKDFRTQAPDSIQKMTEYFNTKSFNDLFQIAHSLKSAAAELDAHDLFKSLQKIENQSVTAAETLDQDPNSDLTLVSQSIQNEIKNVNDLYSRSVTQIQNRIVDIKTRQKQGLAS